MAKLGSESFFKLVGENLESLNETLDSWIPPCGYPIYASMDIRDAGWKVAAVDVNLFPAGFNNLSSQDKLNGAEAFQDYFRKHLRVAPPWNIVLVPEAHTNNRGYQDNLVALLNILKAAQCEVKLMWPGDPIPKPWTLKTSSGHELIYFPRDEALKGAHALLLNHDMSGGIPQAIQNVDLPTFPSLSLGWYRRRKSQHQEIVESLLKKLETQFDFFDPWYFSARTQSFDHIDFSSPATLQLLSEKVDLLLSEISAEYRDRSISALPRIFVKNDSGTYGMGIFHVGNGQELIEEASKIRKKMSRAKEGVEITKIILQESIPTVFTYTDHSRLIVSEPSIYLINGEPMGGFMRIHETLNPSLASFENLNQPGAIYEPLECTTASGGQRPFHLPRNVTPCDLACAENIYGFLAKLHMVAAALEECPKSNTSLLSR